ncbi:MAG TPA: mandelate racemase/muconate lactonizing enzyme family protein [Blastocatellia bacterium]|nr:mandelate racemase/muconate lactonizing enzyme family protein [Blastocatellia bacterium]
MNHYRREFLKTAAAAGALGLAPEAGSAGEQSSKELATKLDKVWAAPVLRTDLIKQPVKIASLELLKTGKHFLVRARSTDGAEGLSVCHTPVVTNTYPILVNKVLPSFVGRDARELETLLTGVYLKDSNYKWQGLPFWVSVACAEIAILDLLGKVAGKPLGELFGSVIKKDIAVYRASGNRGNAPEAEIEYLQKVVAETGAKAIKFRLGARMRYDDASTKRDLAVIPLTRKTFGDAMTIYADANGSYDVPMAVRIGRLLEEQKFRFFEEPVPFDYYDETRQIAGSLKIPIALGEQESSLRGFRRIIETRTARIVQPDLMYFGGFCRSIKVARMAEAAGLECTPHMSGGDLGYLYVAHFASVVPNAGPHQEFKDQDETLPVRCDTSPLKSVNGIMRVPSGPGIGVTIDPDFIRKAVVVTI